MKTQNETKKGTFENPIKMLMIANTLFAIDEVPTKETEKAIYANVMNTSCGSNQSFWIPKSVLSTTTDTFGKKQFVLPAWFIKKTFSWIA